MAEVVFDTRKITDSDSFHDVCSQTFGFPDFYGRNMNAFIDCLSYLSENDGMNSIEISEGERLTVRVLDFPVFQEDTPSIAQAFLECISFINQRYKDAERNTRILLELL